MFKPLTRSFDWVLSTTLARMVRPRGEVPRWPGVPSDPADVTWPDIVEPTFRSVDAAADGTKLLPGEQLSEFEFESPVNSPWPESQTVRGLALGPPDASRAVLVLHCAYEDRYTHPIWKSRSFTQHGYRVLIPAAPCHLQRTPPGVFSGSPIYWSSELFVGGLHQWLAELHGLIGYLRRQGTQLVGVYGNSLGSLAAGMAASLFDNLDFAAMLSPVGGHLDGIQHSPVIIRIWPWMRNLPVAEQELLTRWAASWRQPRVSQLAFFITLYDKMQPTALQEAWWRAWGSPRRYDYAHAHLSIHYSKDFHRDLAEFAADAAGLTTAAPKNPVSTRTA